MSVQESFYEGLVMWCGLIKTMNGSKTGPKTESSITRFWVALLVGFGGMIADVLFGNFMPIAMPQLLAVVVGSRLSKRWFLFLLAFLSIAIVLPAWILAPDVALIQRVVGVASLVLVAYVLRTDVFTDVQQTRQMERVLQAPGFLNIRSSLLRSGESFDDPSAITRDLRHDHSRLIDQLEATGLFETHQIRLIEAQLSALEEYEGAFDSVASLKRGDHVGEYEIEEQLGRGGAGYIFRGHDRKTGHMVAIKILHNSRMSDRFRSEMHMVQELAHPNIVTAYDVADFHGLPFIAMELLRGPDLNQLVQKSGPLCWLESSRYIVQTARALVHAHDRDLIHRDVKPGNIMLSGEESVKLVDLGLAVMTIPSASEKEESADETKDAQIAGTLPYMAPEQAKSLGAANIQSDIYGLGATWFYLLTGKPRLPGKTFSQQFGNLLTKRKFRALPDGCMPDPFTAIYHRMVSYDAQRRYKTCSDLVRDLERALNAAGESVTPDDIHVLVVEDSRADMLRTITVLGNINQSLVIHQATTLQEGIEKYKSMQIDLVLLDLTLPDSSGVQTVKKMRCAAPDVPIVVLTGLSDEEMSAACIEAGATSFISKDELSAHKIERMVFITLSRHTIEMAKLVDPQVNEV